jgi:hypothetical protein
MDLEDRERRVEDAFAHDEELRFRVHAVRDHMLGLWAAEKLGLSGTAADDYARRLMESGVPRFRDDETIGTVLADFAAKKVPVRADEIRAQMRHLLPLALKKLAADVDIPVP